MDTKTNITESIKVILIRNQHKLKDLRTKNSFEMRRLAKDNESIKREIISLDELIKGLDK
mgnify:CR=1 FL=1